jgi:hypothetical protein
MPRPLPLLLTVLALVSPAHALHDPHDGHDVAHGDGVPRFTTSRASKVVLPLPKEDDAFSFVIFGDRTGGPAEGVKILAEAVGDVNLLEPDLVMTVGDLVQGYNETPQWLGQMREFKGIMDRLKCPWFPVVGNHDIYWRGKGAPPPGEHEADFEEHFGPLWYAFRHKKCWFVALYSDEGDLATGRKSFEEPASQRMSPAQFGWLQETLAKAKDAEHVFVFLHHPRWLKGGYGDDWERVHQLLVGAGNVSAVFAGHIHHMRYDGRRDGIEYFALATTGAVQDGFAAEAGYLHEYHVVTVRKDRVAITTYPVGAAMDPRAVTGAISEEVAALAQALAPGWDGAVAMAADLSADAACTLTVRNPTRHPIEVTVTPDSADSRWVFTPDHAHKTVEPGARRAFELHVQRAASTLDAAWRPPVVAVSVEYLGEGLRVPLPERTWDVPLDLATLPLPPAPTAERALALDGQGDCLFVDSKRLALPDGPFTLEGWMCADSFPDRAGFLNNTENSGYGLFVGKGRPEFLVHLGQAYVQADPGKPVLEPGRWYHLAGVFDGSEVRLYVDGQLVASRKGTGARTPNALPLVVGADVGEKGAANSFLPGKVDEVRVSKVARYSGDSFTPQRRFQPDSDTLLLLHMDGELGPWIPDSSGRGVHPTRGGTPKLVPAVNGVR